MPTALRQKLTLEALSSLRMSLYSLLTEDGLSYDERMRVSDVIALVEMELAARPTAPRGQTPCHCA